MRNTYNEPAPKHYSSGRNNALRTIAWFMEGSYPRGKDVKYLSILIGMQKELKGFQQKYVELIRVPYKEFKDDCKRSNFPYAEEYKKMGSALGPMLKELLNNKD